MYKLQYRPLNSELDIDNLFKDWGLLFLRTKNDQSLASRSRSKSLTQQQLDIFISAIPNIYKMLKNKELNHSSWERMFDMALTHITSKNTKVCAICLKARIDFELDIKSKELDKIKTLFMGLNDTYQNRHLSATQIWRLFNANEYRIYNETGPFASTANAIRTLSEKSIYTAISELQPLPGLLTHTNVLGLPGIDKKYILRYIFETVLPQQYSITDHDFHTQITIPVLDTLKFEWADIIKNKPCAHALLVKVFAALTEKNLVGLCFKDTFKNDIIKVVDDANLMAGIETDTNIGMAPV